MRGGNRVRTWTAMDLGDYWSKELVEGITRDPDAVLEDVRCGALSVDDARWQCGVVIGSRPGSSELMVDVDATERMRSALRVAGAAPSGA